MGLGPIGLLHELAVDGASGLELLGPVAQILSGLEERLVEFCDPTGKLLIRKLCNDTVGQELISDETGALGLGEPVLESSGLLGEPVVLGPGVLQIGRAVMPRSLGRRRRCRWPAGWSPARL